MERGKWMEPGQEDKQGAVQVSFGPAASRQLRPFEGTVICDAKLDYTSRVIILCVKPILCHDTSG